MKIKYLFIVLFSCSFILNDIPAQKLDLGIFNEPVGSNKLVIKVRPTGNFVNAAYSQGVFTVRTLTSNNATFTVESSLFGYAFASLPTGVSNVSGSYSYYSYQFGASFPTSNTWSTGQEITIAILTFTSEASLSWFELVKSDPWTITNNSEYYQVLNGQEVQNNLYQTTTSNIVLPVELLSFKADKSGDKTAVQWETFGENNLAYYVVQRSKDGSSFKSIEYQKPKSRKMDEKVTYNYLDEKPELGINYYRLQINDINEKATYSKVVSVDFGTDLKGRTYPNPFSHELSIEIDIKQNVRGNVLIELFDISGKLMIAKNVLAEGRNFSFNLPAEDLTPGTYMIRLTNGSFVWHNKITKQ